MATLLLLLLLCSTTAVCANNCSDTNRVRFKTTASCPTNSTLALLRKLDRFRQIEECVFICASEKNCSVVHRSVDGFCYLGNSQQTSEFFSATNGSNSGACVGYAKESSYFNSNISSTAGVTAETAATSAPQATSTLTATSSEPTSTPETTPTPSTASTTTTTMNPIVQSIGPLASKLVILFDFRQGYTNLVNPSKYAATPHGSVTQDSQGVYFPGGDNNDYIEVDTDGNTLASTYLSHTKSFTFYARLMRRDHNHQTYHYFYDCSSALNLGEFGDNGGRLRVVHSFPAFDVHAQDQVLRESIENVFENNDVVQLASVAAVFVGNSLSNFFKDGSFLSNPNYQSSAYSGEPLCLRLGYHSTASKGLQGRFICYAIAKEALTASELQQLENICDA